MSNEISPVEQAAAGHDTLAHAELVNAAAQVLMHSGLAAAEAYLRANDVQVRSSGGTAGTAHTE